MCAMREIRRTRIISFSGIDGAGKSTQIQRLRARLEQDGFSLRGVCFWDDVAAFSRLREAAGYAIFKGDSGEGTAAAPIRKKDKDVRSWIMSGLRLFLYFADAIALRRLIKNVQSSGVEVCIFDRFIDDELANLPLQNPLIRAYARAIIGLVARPDISYLLDADPAQACARKPEYPLPFLQLYRDSYFELGDLTGRFSVIAPMPIDDVERAVLNIAARHLPLESGQCAKVSDGLALGHAKESAKLGYAPAARVTS